MASPNFRQWLSVRIRNSFQALLQGINGAVGLAMRLVTGKPIADTPAHHHQPDPPGPDGAGSHTDPVKVPPAVPMHPEDKTPNAADAKKVDEMKRAMEKALTIARAEEVRVTRIRELSSVYENRRVEADAAFANRMKNLDAAYSRIDPQQEKPAISKAKAKNSPPNDGYGDEVTEYVFSTLKIALPERRDPGQGISRLLDYTPPNVPSTDRAVEGGSTHSLADTQTSASEDIPTHTPADWQNKSDDDAVNVNFNTWDRTLYAKLPLNHQSIRLVDILPGPPEHDVHVHMDVYNAEEEAFKYEALSYVWGNPEPAQYIFITREETGDNNTKVKIKVKVKVGPSLHAALVALRPRDGDGRRIWIDAVCLNQTSTAEKSKEVQKMGRIYSQAKTVHVFLGAPVESGSSSIGNFFRFLNRDHGKEAADQYAKEGLKALDKICEECETTVQEVGQGFLEACLLPWWGRIWTLQEFYLSTEEPVWYWGTSYASNASLKRDLPLLMELSRHLDAGQRPGDALLSDVKTKTDESVSSSKVDVSRISTLVSRRYATNGFDNPRRFYRDLTAQASNPRDFVYGLRAIFEPAFRRVFVPDYQMRPEMLFACLAVFLVQFEDWGDVLWWYPSRYEAGRGTMPSWLPNFTKRVVHHELDVQPLDPACGEIFEHKLVVLNHQLHAHGYVLDKVYSHRHVDREDSEKIMQELWQFDRCMNQNHECHEYFDNLTDNDDVWLETFHNMYKRYQAGMTHFTSAFKGALLQSTVKPEDGDKLPTQIAECVPCWDLLQWYALKIRTTGLLDGLGNDAPGAVPGYLEGIFSTRMATTFKDTLADMFIGACLFDWGHLSVWLRRFSSASQWASWQEAYWSEVRESMVTNDTEKRTTAIIAGYSGYEQEIQDEVMRVSWCYSFYYAFLAYVILLDCDDHAALEAVNQKLQVAAERIRGKYFSITTSQVNELSHTVPAIALRIRYYNTVLELFRGRILIWTHDGFRGICSPGVETCCDQKSVVAIVDGLSFPVIVRDYDEYAGTGWLAGCALIRGVDMMSKNTDSVVLPADYTLGEKKLFKFR